MLARMDVARLATLQDAAIQALVRNDLPQALDCLDQALSVDFEDGRTLGMLKYVRYWQDRFNRAQTLAEPLDMVDYLFDEWTEFARFRSKIGLTDEAVIHALRTLVFGGALDLLQAYNGPEGVRNAAILQRVGLCHKAVGNYEAARKLFESACRLAPDDAGLLADLGDSYALLGEEELAKLMFKEAFSLDPGSIKLATLDSALINRLLVTVQEQRVAPESVPYWMPVFGILSGVFTVYRQLKPAEYGKLRQQVYNLEREYQDRPELRVITLPKLLNKYFSLLEHAKHTAQPKHIRDELLLKIESLHPGVFKLYTQ
jgi:tetratricopeptide (TPR) repeat protein